MKKQLGKGLYLIIDPQQINPSSIQKLREALEAGLVAVQVWDNFAQEPTEEGLKGIAMLCKEYHTAFIINNKVGPLRWDWIDGIHFDNLDLLQRHRESIKNNKIIGLTVGNQWKEVIGLEKEIDYLSFCSMFPSSTANSCELVSKESVEALSQQVDLPFFLAGGMKIDRLDLVNDLKYQGIAVVSGVLDQEAPADVVRKYKDLMK